MKRRTRTIKAALLALVLAVSATAARAHIPPQHLFAPEFPRFANTLAAELDGSKLRPRESADLSSCHAGSGAVRESVAVYDAKGNPQSTSISGIEENQAFTHTATALFNAAGLPISIDPPGHGADDLVSFTYDATRGNLLPLTRTDPLVGATAFSYDALNRLSTVVDVNNVATSFAYDEMDRLMELRRIGAGATGDLVTTFEYSPLGDIVRVHLPEGNLVEYGYDAAGRVVTVERKPDALTSIERTLVGYNSAGQATSVEAQRFSNGSWQLEASTIYLRSSRCQLDAIRHADGTTTEFSYDCNGNLERVWDANHPRLDFPTQPTATYSWDALNRMQSVSEPWMGGGVAATQFGYDVQDHLREVVDAAGHVTTYLWSDRDLLTSEISEFTGTTSHRYDEAGDRFESIGSRGITASYLRDALGRATAIDLPGTDADSEFVFDAAGVPYSKGRLTSIRRGSSVIDYRFDRFGRLTQEGELAYAYDRNSRRAEITYPHGIQALYGFDHADRPSSLTLREPGRGNTAIVSNALYTAMGPLSRLDLGNGVTEERSFDQRYLPTKIEARRGGANLLDWTYQTDGLGNVLSITDGVDASKSRLYGYQDFAYFLNSASGPWGSLAWEYSKIGDRLAETRDAARTVFREAEVTVAGVERKQRLIEPPTGAKTVFWFDQAGNQTHEVTGNRKLAFEYGNDNRLAKITIDDPREVGSRTELAYDGRGFLASAVKKLPSGRGWAAPTEANRLRATYGGAMLLHRFSESLPTVLSTRPAKATQEDDYVLYFAGRPVAILSNQTVTQLGSTSTSSRKLLYLTTDHLGTPVLATNESGTGVWREGFEPFGAGDSAANAAGVFLRFPGQWLDKSFEGSGLTYNLNRWYDNRTGRYTQADPIGLAGGDALYRYASSNPSTRSDRFGLADKGDSYADEARQRREERWRQCAAAGNCLPPSTTDKVLGGLTALAYGGPIIALGGEFVVLAGEAYTSAKAALYASAIWCRMSPEKCLELTQGIAETVAGVEGPTCSVSGALRRPSLRKGTQEVIEAAALRTPDGLFFVDPNTGQILEDAYHYGHKYGRENRRLIREATARGMSQREFTDWVNAHPEWFHIEDPVSNMSHKYEMPD